MDGNLLISEAHELGLRGHELYKPFNRLYNAIRCFVDRDYFGVSSLDKESGIWIPKHVNPLSNPMPSRDYFGRPCRREFRQYDLVLHLAAEASDEAQRFRFFVNSPKSNFHLLGWDVDANDTSLGHDITGELYFDCFCRKWDYGGHVFIERSRNRRGRYIWTIIERTSPPAEFNMLLNALSRAMRKRYRFDKDNNFDAIKCTLHYDSRDDWDKFLASCDGNINDDHRGVLITFPLAGALARGTFEAERDSFLSFTAKKAKRYVYALPEAHLQELLGQYGPEEANDLADEIAKLRETKAKTEHSPSLAAPLGNTLRMSAPLVGQRESTCGKLTRKAHAEANGKNRMRLASSLHFYRHGRYATSPSALVAFYKAEGFAKGSDTPVKEMARLQRAQEALEDHTANPAKHGFDREYWLDLINQFVSENVRNHEAVKYRSPRTKKVMQVEDDLLAAGLYVLTLSAFAANRIDRMHTCSQVGQKEMYRNLTDVGLLTAAFEDKRKRVAVPVMLQLAGLIVLRDAKHKFGGKDDGSGHAFGLGPNHPRFQEFTARHGNVIDPRSLPSIAMSVESGAA